MWAPETQIARSRTGLPWLANIPATVTAFNGPVNLDWMMTGPQADFWPSRIYTGQFYSENTPMPILAWRVHFGLTRSPALTCATLCPRLTCPECWSDDLFESVS